MQGGLRLSELLDDVSVDRYLGGPPISTTGRGATWQLECLRRTPQQGPREKRKAVVSQWYRIPQVEGQLAGVLTRS